MELRTHQVGSASPPDGGIVVKNLALTAVGAVLLLGACSKTDTYEANVDEAIATENTTSDMTPDTAAAGMIDSAFITDAMQGDNAEVAIGQLAQAQGTSQKVKDFGRLLVDDHGSHKQELKTLAGTAGVAVTDEPSAEGKANLVKLKALSGAEFDKQFKAMMIEDHTKDIAKYEKQAASSDAQTAALAQKTLPVLRKHLDAANAL
jgi:putative membrane protein